MTCATKFAWFDSREDNFLELNTTSIKQPMDQQVIQLSKAKYQADICT